MTCDARYTKYYVGTVRIFISTSVAIGPEIEYFLVANFTSVYYIVLDQQ
jgi:hypothetical protein